MKPRRTASRNRDIMGTSSVLPATYPDQCDIVSHSRITGCNSLRTGSGQSGMGTFRPVGVQNPAFIAEHGIGTFIGHMSHRTRHKPVKPTKKHDVYDSEMTDLPHRIGSQMAHAYASQRAQTPHSNRPDMGQMSHNHMDSRGQERMPVSQHISAEIDIWITCSPNNRPLRHGRLHSNPKSRYCQMLWMIIFRAHPVFSFFKPRFA